MNLLPPINQEQLLSLSLDRTVASGKIAADRVMEQFKKNNLVRFMQSGLPIEVVLMKSLWVHHRLRAVEINVGGLPMTIDLMNLCISGDIETAAFVIASMEPDDMTEPQHFLSSEVLAELAGLLASEM